MPSVVGHNAQAGAVGPRSPNCAPAGRCPAFQGERETLDLRSAEKWTEDACHPRPSRFLVPLDGSPLAERALVPGQCLARWTAATLDLVHVVEPTPHRDRSASEMHAAAEYLRQVAMRIPPEIAAHYSVREGDPVVEILRAAADGPSAILVMATHGRSGANRLLFGSVADKVVRRASVPVVIVGAGMTLPEHGPRHVLVPLDGSELAESALPPVLALIHGDIRLCLVQVVDISATQASFGLGLGALVSRPELVTEAAEYAILEARAALAAVAERLRLGGVRVGWEVRVGHPSDEIIRAAETTGTEMIVMATHGHGGWRRWAFGSVTDEVLHRSSVPVMVISPNADARRGPASG